MNILTFALFFGQNRLARAIAQHLGRITAARWSDLAAGLTSASAACAAKDANGLAGALAAILAGIR